jgi:hypothetical protein
MKKIFVITTLGRRELAGAAALCLVVAFAAIFSMRVSAQQNALPTGRTVKLVKLATPDGGKLGVYKQTGGRAWAEIDREGKTQFTFNEVSRDDSSVYLHDPSRDVSLQLNLHTRKVMYSDPDSPHPRALYNIFGAK